MSLIDFLYGGKKASDIPFWVLDAKMEEIYRRRKKEEQEEYRRREYERENRYIKRLINMQNAFEEAYIDEAIRQVEEKMAREQYDDEEEF